MITKEMLINMIKDRGSSDSNFRVSQTRKKRNNFTETDYINYLNSLDDHDFIWKFIDSFRQRG